MKLEMRLIFFPIKFLLIMVLSFPRSCSSQETSEWCDVNAADCVCNIAIAVKELTELVSRSDRIEFELEEQIRNFRCTSFKKLPTSLWVDAAHQLSYSYYRNRFTNRRYYDRRAKRVKRQIMLGIPTNEVFENAIAHVLPEDQLQYVLLGTPAKFSCSLDSEEEESFPVSKRFKWTHKDGAPISAPQSAVDQYTGILTFKSVQLTDVDVYFCEMELETDTGMQVKQFLHQLLVVSEPVFWLKIRSAYFTSFCRMEDADLINENIKLWIASTICELCSVHNVSVGCTKYHTSDQSHEEAHRYEIRLAISLIGLELDVPRLKSCPITCMEAIHLTIMEIIRNSVDKLSYLPIEISYGESDITVYPPIVELFSLHLAMGCLGGFSNFHKLCIPCKPGAFSPEDSSECFPCQIGYYQELPGSTYCTPCADGYNTVEEGSVSPEMCLTSAAVFIAAAALVRPWLIILIVFLCLIVIIICTLIGIRCCCAGTSCGKFVTRFCCCCCASSEYSESNDTVQYSELKNKKVPEHNESRRERKPGNTSRRNSQSRSPEPPNRGKDTGSSHHHASLRKVDKNQGRSHEKIESKISPTNTISSSDYQIRRNQTNANLNHVPSKISIMENDSPDLEEQEEDTDISLTTQCGHGFHRCIKENTPQSMLKKVSNNNRVLTNSSDDDEIRNKVPLKPPPKPPPMPR